MGAFVNAHDERIAVCVCKGGLKEAKGEYVEDAVKDCRERQKLKDGRKLCSYGCLGDGTCAAECAFGAITMDENRLPVVDPEKCTGCGVCAEVCPRSLFILVSPYDEFHVRCMNMDKGAETRKVCTVGCIGCMKCERICPFDAIHVNRFVAEIDYSKCMNCGMCERVCSNGTIFDVRKAIRSDYARVDANKCFGCSVCASLCPAKCIDMEHGHAVVDEDACIGCEICVRQCPEKAISSFKRTSEEKAAWEQRLKAREEAEKEAKRKAREAAKAAKESSNNVASASV